jgi:hypothetical protein
MTQMVMKNKIRTAVIFLIFLFLPKIIFAQWNINDPAMVNSNLPQAPVLGIVGNLVFWFLAMLETISLIAFIVAGILYLTAAGDETQIGKAKKAMTYSTIGVIVGLSGFVIMQAAAAMLNGNVF